MEEKEKNMSKCYVPKKIKTVGELRKYLELFPDEKLVNIGTQKYGYDIDHVGNDDISIALMGSTIPTTDRIAVDLGFTKLVAELNDHGDGYKEVCVGLEDKDGCWFQDMAVIGNDVELDDDIQPHQKDGHLIIRVYADKDDEDYTNKYIVGLHEEEDDE
jgi:hypothetical protein